MKLEEVQDLQKVLTKEGVGTVTSVWRETITHLVVNQVTLTVKVANALAKGVPIVTPAFFADFNTSLESRQARHFRIWRGLSEFFFWFCQCPVALLAPG